MRFPSIKEVAAELREINASVEGECDVRLQVYESGEWWLRVGDASYDQDHRGFWGASCVPGVVNGRARRFQSREVARDLIDQAADQYYCWR